MKPRLVIDIHESSLRSRDHILDILLTDMTKKSDRHKLKNTNIIWATDSYTKYGEDYAPKKPILREQITGLNGKLIQPRAAKSREEQLARIKDKAEVFTPLKIVGEMNKSIDWSSKNFPASKDNWIDYIMELRLEITCGEAPFIASRYNPIVTTRIVIKPKNRVGFLDRKLQVVSEFTHSNEDWLKYAEMALKASYGYEWQGDNLLIARENILQTIDDFYQDFCSDKLKVTSKTGLNDAQLEHFAEIIAWNIWQMDGIKCVIPLSCKNVKQIIPGLPLFGEKDTIIKEECPGCKTNNAKLHNGKYALIMDWKTGKPQRFVDITD